MARRYSDGTLKNLPKAELIELLKIAWHNEDVAKATLEQHIENVKDWKPCVECKDCQYWSRRSEANGICQIMFFGKPENGFCNRGERKTDEVD